MSIELFAPFLTIIRDLLCSKTVFDCFMEGWVTPVPGVNACRMASTIKGLMVHVGQPLKVTAQR